jgi:hypothetical protein
MEVKQALRDSRFRESLGESFKADMIKYLDNPSCGCNMPIYRRILKEARSELKAYYPNRELAVESEEVQQLAENHWMVINCKITELEDRLRRLSVGRKQIAIARYEDEVTVIVNELDIIF